MSIHAGVDRSRGDAHSLAFPTGLEKNGLLLNRVGFQMPIQVLDC